MYVFECYDMRVYVDGVVVVRCYVDIVGRCIASCMRIFVVYVVIRVVVRCQGTDVRVVLFSVLSLLVCMLLL